MSMFPFSGRDCLIFFASLFIASTYASALDPAKLFDKVSKSVVLVINNSELGAINGIGSGVVTAPQRVITNCHVLRRAKSVEVKVGNARYGATLLYPDTERDLCLLEVQDLPLPSLEVANLNTLKVGQKVYAVGAPQGLELTLSDGLISSIRGKAGDQLIQTSAPISQGSSGGGLFDDQGRLIGITTATLKESQNLNFAIPAEYIAEVPARGKTALAKLEEKKRPEINSASGQASPPVYPERKLTAAEIASHFDNNSQIVGKSGANEMRLEISNWNRGFTFTTTQAGYPESVSGVREIDFNRDAICFRPSNFVAVTSPLNFMVGCFTVHQTGVKDFALKYLLSADKRAIITYSIK